MTWMQHIFKTNISLRKSAIFIFNENTAVHYGIVFSMKDTCDIALELVKNNILVDILHRQLTKFWNWSNVFWIRMFLCGYSQATKWHCTITVPILYRQQQYWNKHKNTPKNLSHSQQGQNKRHNPVPVKTHLFWAHPSLPAYWEVIQTPPQNKVISS